MKLNNLIVLGKETSVAIEFCLFTCYLLHEKMFHVFDILCDQFKAASATNSSTLTAGEFKDFFDKCNLYVLDVLEKSDEKLMGLKVILRMIGALSIGKQAFDRYYDRSVSFANTIMSYVRACIWNLYDLMKEEEWILFHKGLATLLSIELLQCKFNSNNENKVIFLQQIPDERLRQVVANKLLNRLCKLGETICGDMNWTDLFEMVDPIRIDISHLNLTNSFETLIICITKISKVLRDYSTFENDFGRYLDERISKKSIESKMINRSPPILC